jgi:hypothetical protein
MKKGLTIAAVAALALGVAACGGKSGGDTNTAGNSTDNMLVPADENAMGDMNATDNMAMDNSAMAGNDAGAMAAGNAAGGNAQ